MALHNMAHTAHTSPFSTDIPSSLSLSLKQSKLNDPLIKKKEEENNSNLNGGETNQLDMMMC